MAANMGRKVILVSAPSPQIAPNKDDAAQCLSGAQAKTAIALAVTNATKLSFPRRAISGNQPGKTKGQSAGAIMIAWPLLEPEKFFAATKAAIHRDDHAAT